jgi:hypothetical protein
MSGVRRNHETTAGNERETDGRGQYDGTRLFVIPGRDNVASPESILPDGG